MCTDVRDIDNVKGAEKINDALNSISKAPSNLIGTAEAISAESQLAEFLAVGGDVQASGRRGACVEESFLEGKGFGKHAAAFCAWFLV